MASQLEDRQANFGRLLRKTKILDDDREKEQLLRPIRLLSNLI